MKNKDTKKKKSNTKNCSRNSSSSETKDCGGSKR